MRKTYRAHNTKDYWEKRWKGIPIDSAVSNTDVYPLKYAQMVVGNKTDRILEAGCGNGRVLQHYDNHGYNIEGFDYIEDVIHRLKEANPSLKVCCADVTNLNYESNSFNSILAFGLYHNLEVGLDKAIDETYRILKPNGLLCASFRADNFQNRLNDKLAEKKKTTTSKLLQFFHKLNLKKKELEKLFKKSGFVIQQILPVENMPLLYKFKFFRANNHKQFNESLGRTEGYQLSFFGRLIQGLLIKLFPNQFCNVYVLIAEKEQT